MAKRQSNGDGTRAKQMPDGRWRIDMTISDDGENKGRKSLYGKTEPEVIAKRDSLKKEMENGCLVSSQADKLALGTWLDEWLEVYKKGKIGSNTYVNYRNAIKIQINDKLRNMKLKKIRHDTLQKAINELGKEYSGGTCSIVRVVLQQAFNMATKNKYIISNPAIGLTVPPTIKKEVAPLTNKEVNILLADRKNTRSYLYYVLSVYTGARIGEVLGLSWNDIDLKNNIIHIRHSLKLNKITNKYEIGPTKTGKCRDVPILPKIINAIKQHKGKQAEEKLKIGQTYNVNNMVFCDNVGDHLKIKTMSDEMKKTVKLLELNPDTTPHTLRHTFVSQLISAGNASITLISKIVGHANITVTLNTYSHLMPNDMKGAFEALEKHLEKVII